MDTTFSFSSFVFLIIVSLIIKLLFTKILINLELFSYLMKTLSIAIAIVALSFIIAFLVYPYMPNKMISHWNSLGEADGYSGKFIGLFLIPIISLGLLLLFSFLPRIDPLKKNYKKFMHEYNCFVLLFVFYLFYLYVLTLVINYGFKLDMNTFFIPALAFLFYYIGVILGKAKRNWFVGIRTPWTMSSDYVWDKTHKLGSKLFKISGVISLIGLFFRNFSYFFVLVPVILFSIYLVIYSYLIFRKTKKKR
jgi:uncharacterized membrane protein